MFFALPTVLSLSLLPATAIAFSFSYSTPTQCDNLTITWTGGQAPYQLLLTPRFDVARNISIPADASGTFTTQLALSEHHQFVLTMSDATGFGTGGTSELLTVGDTVSGTNCNTSTPTTAFTFSLPNALQQCSVYTFDEYNNAIQPVAIYALIPGGQATIFNPPQGAQYDWPAVDVASGTSMIFLMVDAQGRQGGSSDLEQVQANTDVSCLNAQSPSSTVSPSASPTSTKTSLASTTGSSSTSSAPTAIQTTTGKVSIAAVAGTVLGALVLLAVMVTLGLFFLRKSRNESRSPYGGPGITGAITGRRRSQRIASVDLASVDSPDPIGHEYAQRAGLHAFAYPAPNSASAASYTPPILLSQSGLHEPNPFVFPAAPGHHTRQSSKATVAPLTPMTYMTDGEASQGQRQKAAMAGMNAHNKPARFIVHTDVEEADPDIEDIVELPPQYTDRRPPLVDVKRQPSSSVRRQASTSMQRQASTVSRMQHSTSVRKRSGNVPHEDLPSISPRTPALPPPSGGRF